MQQLQMMSIMGTFSQKVSFNLAQNDICADELCRYSGGAEHLVNMISPSMMTYE
jgi:hypothetical protein